MYDSHDLIRQKTRYTQAPDGSWKAEFPGRTFRIVVTAPTLEEARANLVRDFDERLFAFLCDDLQIAPEDRPRSFSAMLAKSARAQRKALRSRPSAK